MDIGELKYRLLDDVESVLQHLLPLGKLVKNEYCVGSLAGEAGESLRVNISGSKRGVWSDFSTGEKGDIIDLWRLVNGTDVSGALTGIRSYLGLPSIERKKKAYKKPEMPPFYVKESTVFKYLSSVRKISRETLSLFAIAWDDKDIIFPSYRDNTLEDLVHWKKIAVERPDGKKRVLSSPGTERILFGWQAILNENGRSIIICEGEIDAMSFREYGYEALSLPFGGGGGDKQAWLENEIENLQRYDTIYLAIDDDYEGHEAAREIITRLGSHRCKLVTLPYKDCNECLVNGVSKSAIEEAIQNAKSLSIEQIKGIAPSGNGLPYSTELEQFALSWLLGKNENKNIVFEMLEPEDFYWQTHREIFKSAQALFNSKTDIEISSIITVLTKKKIYGDLIARGHLEDLLLIFPGTPIPDVCSQIRSMATRRMLSVVGQDIVRYSIEQDDSSRAVYKAQQQVLKISERESSRSEIMSLAEAMGPVIARIEHNMLNPTEIRGLPIGFTDIDLMTGGFTDGQLIVAAGRAAMGKTAFLLNVVYHVVVNEQKPCILFSMEMSKYELFYRLISIHTGVPTKLMKSGALTVQQYRAIADFYLFISGFPLFIQDTSRLTTQQLRTSIERAMSKEGNLLAALDYLQLLRPSEKCGNRLEAISAITADLKAMAKDLSIPILALAQLSREAEKRSDKRPMMSDLRESGSIEQDADIVMLLYRDEYYTKENCECPGIAEINIAKQREGPTGVVKLRWNGSCTRFENIEKRAIEMVPPF